jgi:hypothetical protein
LALSESKRNPLLKSVLQRVAEQTAILPDEGGLPTLVQLARMMSDAENSLVASGCWARVVPVNVDVPRTYTCVHDAAHGCPRRGQYHLERPIATYGSDTTFDQLLTSPSADCSRLPQQHCGVARTSCLCTQIARRP